MKSYKTSSAIPQKFPGRQIESEKFLLIKNHKGFEICREILRVLASNIFGGELIHSGKNKRLERKF